MSNLSPVDTTNGHPLTTSVPSSPLLSPLDAASLSRANSTAGSDFDVFSYLNDEELYSGTDGSHQQNVQQHIYSSSSSSSSSFNFVPRQPGQSTALRRRGSSRSSVVSAMLTQQNGLQDAGINANHRRDVSSSSAADIGLRGLHTRDLSYNAVSPTYDPIHYASGTGHGQLHTRPLSSATWSQISLDDLQQQRDIQAQTGLYDSPTQANFSWDDGGPIASTSSGTGYPPNVENAAGVDNSSDSRRRSNARRSRAKSVHYKRRGDAESQGLGRRKTMIDNAKRELKRMSVRVVNINQRNDTRHVRMEDNASSDSEDGDPAAEPVSIPAVTQIRPIERVTPHDPGIPGTPRSGHQPFSQVDDPLQGRTLCLFGSKSRIRRAAMGVFLWP